MRVVVFIVIFFISIPYLGLGQTDTVRVLDEVEVISSPWEQFVPSHKKYTADSVIKSLVPYQNLASRLNYIAPVNIRSYGVTGLTTISQRGFGGGRTKILWHGIDLQSLSNGSLDIGQIPAFFFDNMTLYSGGQSAVAGSAAIGGILNLEPLDAKTRGDNQSQLFLRAASFGSLTAGGKTELSKGKHSGDIKIFYQKSDNDYPFINTYKSGAPKERLAHANRESGSVSADYSFQLSDKIKLSSSYWGLFSDSQLPPLASKTSGSQEEQNDRYHRGAVNFSVKDQQYDLRFTSGVDLQKILYLNNATDLESETTSFRWQNNLLYTYYLDNWTFNFTGKANREEVTFNNEGYPRIKERLTGELSGFIRYEPKAGTIFTAGINQSMAEDISIPTTPSLSVSHQLGSVLTVHGEFSRVFRIPTFNDLYWQGAGAKGNPDLRPESGYNGGIGINFKTSPAKYFNSSLSLDLYSTTLNDQIVWAPDSEGDWTPMNLQKVWSRGIELESVSSIRYGESEFLLRLNYQMTRASLMKDNTISDEYTGTENQLFYTPEHIFGANLSVKYRRWLLAIFNQFTGDQYTTLDNNERWKLEGWFLSDVNLAYIFSVGKNKISVSGEVKNIFDTEYEVRRERIMPGRNYGISINLLLNH
ncbi:TonB-dependent receptor [Mangrovivirga sp. M17]|uniref:TonB-dependent receptor n=1 Tax=Mangrovivirga halotolerans TaxID=2993936 RepID=A0ABT3RUT7_9BACT|nr:TonB-dependent receptor [Mangrovivirga halotolerans]MCX2745108.1 TonB-dependent receptor [Mangrovivirga halotolerans]